MAEHFPPPPLGLPPEQARLMRLATIASTSVALILIGAKAVAWWYSGSVSMLSTLLDSTLDLLASLVTLLSVRHALMPADREHRFGHGKAEALAGLLLDVEDTAVTRQTAEALARVGTAAAMRLIALTVAAADDNQADWLQTGVTDALVGPDDAPDVAVVCGQLARDPEEAVRRGAVEISVWADDTGC